MMRNKKSIFAFLNLKQGLIFAPAYEGEDEAAAAKAAEEAAAKAAEDEATAAAAKKAADEAAGKKFTQEDVDRMMKQRLAKSEKTTTDLARRAEELASSVQMTQEERDSLSDQLEEVRNQYKSESQIAKETADKAAQTHGEALKKEQDATSRYKNLYETNLIDRSIQDAMTEFEALPGPSIPAVLGKITAVKETLGEDGKPTGIFAPVVSFPDVNDDQQPVTMSLSVRDAIKRMSETPETYGNLFKGPGAGGVGSSNAQGARPQAKDISKMTPAAYAQARKDGKLPHQQQGA